MVQYAHKQLAEETSRSFWQWKGSGSVHRQRKTLSARVHERKDSQSTGRWSTCRGQRCEGQRNCQNLHIVLLLREWEIHFIVFHRDSSLLFYLTIIY